MSERFRTSPTGIYIVLLRAQEPLFASLNEEEQIREGSRRWLLLDEASQAWALAVSRELRRLRPPYHHLGVVRIIFETIARLVAPYLPRVGDEDLRR